METEAIRGDNNDESVPSAFIGHMNPDSFTFSAAVVEGCLFIVC